MNAELRIESSKSSEIAEVLSSSLRTDDKVGYSLRDGEELEIQIETDTLGRMRGATDTALMLSMLAEKTMLR